MLQVGLPLDKVTALQLGQIYLACFEQDQLQYIFAKLNHVN